VYIFYKNFKLGFGIVKYALYIYAIGGRTNTIEGNTDLAIVERYDPFTNR
jgi:hypothetical protein